MIVSSIWLTATSRPPDRFGPLCDEMDVWKHCIRILRHHLRGWGANVGGNIRARKEALMREVKEPDVKADNVGLSQEEWARRYGAEEEMIFILTCEEMYWQQ